MSASALLFEAGEERDDADAISSVAVGVGSVAVCSGDGASGSMEG
jgi:hypothetical protein